jgi:hypothetical protein
MRENMQEMGKFRKEKGKYNMNGGFRFPALPEKKKQRVWNGFHSAS